MEDANAKDSCTKAPLEEIGGGDAPNAKGIRSFVARVLFHQRRSRQQRLPLNLGFARFADLSNVLNRPLVTAKCRVNLPLNATIEGVAYRS